MGAGRIGMTTVIVAGLFAWPVVGWPSPVMAQPQLAAAVTVAESSATVAEVPVLSASRASGRASTQPARTVSITDRRVQWPTWDQWKRVLTLRDYNTRVVVFCTTLLGCAAGIIGSFTLLRRRALMGDAISHATLPGIALAFMIAVSLGYNGKSLPILLTGATVSGLVGVGIVLLLRNLTRLKEDTALGAVLSVFFGAGVSLLGMIQQMEAGHAAGLEAFIYGKTASMGAADARLIATAAAISLLVCLAFFRDFKLLCFDDQFASSAGYPVVLLDLLLMSLVVAVTIVGLQTVGLILMIALLVIPAAAARFWTQRMVRMVLVAGVLGAVSGMLGAACSAILPRIPSGAMIVLLCTGFFLISLLFGGQRGVLVRWWRRRRLNQSIRQQHLLRAIYEILENRLGLSAMAYRSDAAELAETVSLNDLLPLRSWSEGRLRREFRRAQRADLVRLAPSGDVQLTAAGLKQAERLTRQHRLWEIYLITNADVATARVDRDADAIEHILEPEIVRRLEKLLAEQFPQFPASPHVLLHPDSADPTTNSAGDRHGD